MNSLADRKVRTLDDSLRLFQNRDLNSPVIEDIPEGAEVQLGAASEIEGREWVEAATPGGSRGYLVSASARSHTEPAGKSSVRSFGVEQMDTSSQPSFRGAVDFDALVTEDSEYDAALRSVLAEFNAKFAGKEQLDLKDLCEFRRYAKSCTDLRAEDLTSEEAAWKTMYQFLTAELEKMAPGLLREIEPHQNHLDNLDKLQEMMEAKLKARPHDLGFKVSWGFLIGGFSVGWLRSSNVASILAYGLSFWIAGVLFSMFILDSGFVQSVIAIGLGKIGLRAISNSLYWRAVTIRYTDDEIRVEVFRLNEEYRNAKSAQARATSKTGLRRLIQRYPEAAQRGWKREVDRCLDDYNDVLEPHLRSNEEIDLSGAAAEIRKQMAWPESGSVRGLPGAEDDIVAVLEQIEAGGGKVSFKDAIKLSALVDPNSPQAYLLRYRSEHNVPPV